MVLPTYRLRYTNVSARETARQMLPQMEIDPEYQRGHVWTVKQRQELIKSWLMGVPTGNITINLRDNTGWRENHDDLYAGESPWIVYGCVDGKQRIETARMWFAGELDVPADWFEEDDIRDEIPKGAFDVYVNYLDLILPVQRHHGTSFQFSMIEAQLPTLQAEAELFLLVNGGGTAQESEVMQRARELAGR